MMHYQKLASKFSTKIHLRILIKNISIKEQMNWKFDKLIKPQCNFNCLIHSHVNQWSHENCGISKHGKEIRLNFANQWILKGFSIIFLDFLSQKLKILKVRRHLQIILIWLKMLLLSESQIRRTTFIDNIFNSLKVIQQKIPAKF